jgi:anti-sigma B factor antagonist
MSSDAMVKTELQGSLGIISLSGDISGTADEALRSSYEYLAKAGSTKILFRFGQGCYINSAGIAVLILIVSEAKKSKQKVGAVGLTSHFRKIFDMIGLTDYITIYSSEADAKKEL